MPPSGQRWGKIDDGGEFPVCSQAKMGKPPSAPNGPDLDAAMLLVLSRAKRVWAVRNQIELIARFSERLLYRHLQRSAFDGCI
jgi:hypothetical protein